MGRLAAAALVVLASGAAAAPRGFVLTWDSETQAAGTQELQTESTERLYRRVENVQQGYLATDDSMLFVRGVTDSGELFAGVRTTIEVTGVSTVAVDPRAVVGWHHRLLSPRDLVGLSLLGRGALGLDALELELRAAVDRVVGPVVVALNLGALHTFLWNGRAGADTRLEESVAARFTLKNGFSTGVEGLVRETFQREAFEGTAVYVGPALAFRTKRFWASAGIYAQVCADKAPEDRHSADPLEVSFNERFWIRLVLAPTLE